MNDTTNKVLWALGAVIVAVILVSVLHLGGAVPKSFGAITSPATQLDYLNLTQALGFGPNAQTQGSLSTNISGGRAVITPASLVFCSIPNPFNATSTIINASLNITTGTSSAGFVVPAVASSATATTTPIGQGMSIAANAIPTLQTSGISSTTDLGVAVGPGQFLNWGTVATSAVGYPYTYGGTCNATFESAN